MNGDSLLRTFSVARKELLHILRDPQTLFFTLFVPVLELFMLGYAIDTNVRHVRTVVCDFAQTKDSRNLLESMENSQDFTVVALVCFTLGEVATTWLAAVVLAFSTVELCKTLQNKGMRPATLLALKSFRATTAQNSGSAWSLTRPERKR